ncbi:MAG TPA: hypothetical protein VE913_01905 [Longimicrobium sp.]|nr:hypothetical protein [Longimicrobium sp.]
MLHEKTRATEVEVKDRVPSEPMCEPQPFRRASSTLLSRLAEAVDGHRKGKAVVYVAEFLYDKKKGHKLHGPFPNCEDAREFRATELSDPEGNHHGIFGPFYTLNGGESSHPRVRVEMVVVHLTDGNTIELSPDDADAVFWSRAAVEKFVIPYYVAIGTYAEGGAILDTLNDAVALVHRPGSEWRSETPGIRVGGEKLDREEDPGIGTVVIKVSNDKSGGGDLIASPLL